MDYFSLCLDGFCLAGQALMHTLFVSHLTRKKPKAWYYIAYIFLLCGIEYLSARFHIVGILSISMEIIVLYCMSRFVLGNLRSVSCVSAFFAVYIFQLSFGIINSLEAIIFPDVIGKTLLYLLVVLAALIAFVICAFCYVAALKLIPLAEDNQMPYIGVLLFPGLFFFAAELYILRTSYSVLPTAILPERMGTHGALLLLQVLGLAALLCTLYAYRQIFRGFQTQADLQSLTQAAQAQKVYITEAQMRYERTKAFRHDIKNHLSVLDGLLSNGKLDEGRAYLHKLEIASVSLSFPHQTGNPVVDILLEEKLGLAKTNGIMPDVSLLLPSPCGIDDFDLCVIFANALDNAINACQCIEGSRSIRIRGERQGDFYMLTFENTCSDKPLPLPGTGLSNIRSVAKKYHGAILVETAEQIFSLNVLLNISLHPESISIQQP